MRNLVLDFGNTQLKLALFSGKDLIRKEYRNTLHEVLELCNELEFDRTILSSVLHDRETSFFISQFNHPIVVFGAEMQLPIQINYQTPDTLGKDRLANACFAAFENQKKNSLIIDIGTCLKFDFVDDNASYKGGSISPGLQLRFKALNNYTGKLPLVDFEHSYDSLIGDDTNSSILSGVVVGMEQEINGMIRKYEEDFPDLTIFITGGDADKFDIQSKNTIFADQNITLKGLNEILDCTK